MIGPVVPTLPWLSPLGEHFLKFLHFSPNLTLEQLV